MCILLSLFEVFYKEEVSRVNEDGIPFNIVLDKIKELINVIITPKTTKATTINAATIELALSDAKVPPTKIIDNAIKVGNLPLQGTKLLVNIAINLSLGESIILQAITPAALHPNPIHMVNTCFPWQQAFLKALSKLKHTLGKYPLSSNMVNNGKNIAIGGSITEITQAKVYIFPALKYYVTIMVLLS